MTDEHLNEATLRTIQSNMLEYVAGGDAAPVETSADDIVSVKMSAHFKVESITLRSEGLGPDTAARLEGALITAINAAIDQTSRRASDRLRQLMPEPRKR